MMKKSNKLIVIALLSLMFFSLSFLSCKGARAAEYTKSKVQSMLKEAKKKQKQIKKKYDSDKSRVKKANKGKYWISNNNFLAVPNTYNYSVRTKKKIITIVGGWGNLDIYQVSEDILKYYHVSGYVKNTKVYNTNPKTYFVKGVKLTKNKYRNQLNSIENKIDELNRALHAYYEFDKKAIKKASFSVNKSYKLTKYLQYKLSKYDVQSWSVDDDSIASISDDGVLTFNKAGTVAVTVKSKISGKHTTVNLSCYEDIRCTLQDVNTLSTITKNSSTGVYELHYTQKARIIISGSKSGNGYECKYSSSSPTIATVDDTGIITVGTQSGSCTITVSSDASVDPYEIRITAVPMSWNDKLVGINTNSQFFVRHDNSSTNVIHEVGNTEYGEKIQISHEGSLVSSMKFTYESSDEKVATVDSSGLILITGNGMENRQCTIKIDNGFGSSHLVEITVSPCFKLKVDYTPAENSATYRFDSSSFDGHRIYSVYLGDKFKFYSDPNIYNLTFVLDDDAKKYLSVDQSTGTITIVNEPSGSTSVGVDVLYGEISGHTYKQELTFGIFQAK